MSRLMLIDAAHPEETRVAIVNNGQVDDFDFESTGSEQLRGNIYLAKVTRVEPSLQAAFVEYGGNRHGFLAFSEIHPDYYQLPAEDREALLREAAEEAAAAIEDDDDDDGPYVPHGVAAELEHGGDRHSHHDHEHDHDHGDEDNDGAEADAEAGNDEADGDENGDDDAAPRPAKPRARSARSAKPASTRTPISKRYKIQEVIRRRQVMLVQVVKEERGNKGAALTTYLSLAGRYSVLMPNTPRGGGISRKIANSADRKRLKSIVAELDVPDGQGLIVRTAGAKRTKAEIKRDYDYLSKLWEQIVEKTLTSDAPALINAEGGLVHRAMRDMFDKEIEEVWVQGDEAYREAKDLAKIIMPSQAKKVQQWRDEEPLYVAEAVEGQLDSIYSPVVQLKSGGYLVINQTEALVAIDVNSGKSTRERNIEQTAVRTNLEAAEEACRQMRLRDLAGLIVIDFIDMEENKNNRAVEKRLKECLKVDRARVQHGRISQFGLMEISRQRRRQGVLQATSDPCEACNGTGRRRSIPSAALQLIRAIEARAAIGALKGIAVKAPTDVALYILNNKREALIEIERVAGFAVSILSSEDMLPGDFQLDAERDPNAKPKKRATPRSLMKPTPASARDDDDEEIDDEEIIDTAEDDEDEDDAPRAAAPEGGNGGRKRRRRRRGGKGREPRDTGLEVVDAETAVAAEGAASDNDSDEDDDDDESDGSAVAPRAEGEDGPRKRRRRGRRGGRRRRRSGEPRAEGSEIEAIADGGAYLDGLSSSADAMLSDEADAEPGDVIEASAPDDTDEAAHAEPEVQTDAEVEAEAETPKAKARPRRSRAKPAPAPEPVAAEPVAAEVEAEAGPEPVQPEPEPAPAAPESVSEPEPVMAEAEQPKAEPAAPPAPPQPEGPKKTGWWNRGRK